MLLNKWVKGNNVKEGITDMTKKKSAPTSTELFLEGDVAVQERKKEMERTVGMKIKEIGERIWGGEAGRHFCLSWL
jgi:hypothetical protein